MNSYESRRQEKIERFERAAKLSMQAYESTLNQASRMSSVIPMGQPILVGHHSEKRDRNYRAKIDRRYEKATELKEKAAYYQGRAISMRNNKTISSDNPEASELIKEKIIKLETMQNKMKGFNKALKKNDIDAMHKLGFTDTQIAKLKQPDFCNRLGFPGYALTNNSGNIRRLKKRLELLEKSSNTPCITEVIKGITMEENEELNRLQLFFNGKPSEETRNQLKQSGFHWSPREGAWQRQRSNRAIYLARNILNNLQ